MDTRFFARFWIIIAAATLLVIIFLVGWFISLEITENGVFEKYNQRQLFLVEGTAGGIEGLFDDLEAGLGSLGTLPVIQYVDEQATRLELVRKLDELSPQGVIDVGLLDSNGTAIAFAVQREAEGTDYSWRSYYKDAETSKPNTGTQTLIVELQTLDQGVLGFQIAIPVFATTTDENHPTSDSSFAGVILAALTFDTLIERYVEPFKPPGDGKIFLVNGDYDVIWSSDSEMDQATLLSNRWTAFSEMVDEIATWSQNNARGGAYTYSNSSVGNNADLIAYAPVKIGQDILAIGVSTPGGVARQTSLSSIQSQQLVFILSLATILVGVIVGGLVLRRETKRRFELEESLKFNEREQAILAERNRLAGDLHDSVTQGLYGIVLHTDAALGQIAAGDMGKAVEYIEDVKKTGKEGLAEMRLLINELRPPVLEDEGLESALESRLFAVEKRAGMEVQFSSGLDSRPPMDIEEGFYRIAQEALNNALKHAQAKLIQVNLISNGKEIIMEIIDDGCGCDIQFARGTGGMGIAVMEERAQKINARMTIESRPGEGTRIRAEVSV